MAEIRVNSTGGVKFYDADDSHYAQIKAGTITSDTDVLTLGHDAVVAGTKVDLNGQELILDADADTSITADTDDQIDVRIAGADDFQFTANTFTAQSGSSIVVPDGGLTFGSTAISSTAAELNILDGVTSTAAELNILDGVTSTAAELNLLDGGTSVGSSITLADADGVVVNDGGTMKTIPASDIKTYAAGGRATLIDTITLSNTTAPTFDSSDITSSFDNYLFVFENIQPGSGNVSMQAQLSNNNGSSYEGDSANDYRRIKIGGRQDTSQNSILSDQDDTTNRIAITGLNNVGNDAALKIDGFMYLFTPNSSSYKKTYSVVTYGEASDPPLFILDTAAHIADHTQSVINNVKFVMSSGNFASGKIKLFGLA
jgi:hypothetical protein